MAVQSIKYCEYFDVNEKYFPCIDESAMPHAGIQRIIFLYISLKMPPK